VSRANNVSRRTSASDLPRSVWREGNQRVGFPRLRSGQAHPLDRTTLSDEERVSRANNVSRGTSASDLPRSVWREGNQRVGFPRLRSGQAHPLDRTTLSDEERVSRANNVSRGTLKKFPILPHGWCCYLLLCSDGSYYCGITSNLLHRIRDHASGKGGTYTKAMKPVALVWYCTEPNRHAAAKREQQIKRWGNEKKQKLASGDPAFSGIGSPVSVSLG
jgi:putative endonuclease